MGKVREVREKLDKYVAPNYDPPMFLQRFGKGEWLYGLVEETDGTDGWRAILDLHSNYSATGLGHNPPELVDLTIQRFLENRVVFVSRGAAISEELADLGEKLSQISGIDMILPKNVGTEAFDLALKSARLWGYRVKGIKKNKAEVIVCKGCFHGRSLAATMASSDPVNEESFGPFGAERAFRKILFGDLKALEKDINKNTAAFIVEPVQGEGGVIIPPDEYIREAMRICRENNVLFILDEVQTGMGRTGKLFCWQHYIPEDPPDGMLLAKNLGGGMAKESVFIARRDVLDLLTEGTEGTTFGGDPGGCAVALATLDIILWPGFLERVAYLGEEFVRKLRTIDSPLIKEVRGKGLLIAVEIDPRYNIRQVWEELLRAGILCIKRKSALGFSPPLNISEYNLLVHAFYKIKRVLENFPPA